MILTNNSPDLCVLTLCIQFRQNNLYLASLPRISANSNEIMDVITSRLWLIFPEIPKISRKFTTLHTTRHCQMCWSWIL